MDYSKINIKNIYIKRHIELAVVKVDGDQVTFRIAEQTHRGVVYADDAKDVLTYTFDAVYEYMLNKLFKEYKNTPQN